MSAPTTVWDFKIGGISLTKFEVPSEFTVGHDNKVAKHYFLDVNGVATIKTHFQGSFPVPTEWKGTFVTNTALARAQQLDKLCSSGSPITWQYGPYNWQVVVDSFHYTPKWQFEVDYEIKLTVVKDNNATIASTQPVSIDTNTQQFFDYGNSAYGALLTSNPSVPIPSSISTSYNAATAALQAAYPLSSASLHTLLAVSNLLGVFTTNTLNYTTGLQGTATLEKDLAALNAALQALQGFGLLNENVQQLIGTTPANTVVVATSSTIFALAALYYPNTDVPTAAQAIYTANGLTDTVVIAGTLLALPQVYQ
jgi:hypothetical protein